MWSLDNLREKEKCIGYLKMKRDKEKNLLKKGGEGEGCIPDGRTGRDFRLRLGGEPSCETADFTAVDAELPARDKGEC